MYFRQCHDQTTQAAGKLRSYLNGEIRDRCNSVLPDRVTYAKFRVESYCGFISLPAQSASVTGLLNLVRKLSSLTYIRGANIIGGGVLLAAVGILIFATGRYDVPVREVLLAAPGIFAAVGAVWYNMLNSPDPMILLVNIVPTNERGAPVAADEYLYQTIDDNTVRVSPQQKHHGTDPVSSFITPWTVESESVASDAVVSFDVTNRGYQPVVLHEYRVTGEGINETVVALSPEKQFLEKPTVDGQQQQESNEVGGESTANRHHVRPGERLSEQLRLSELVQGDVWEQDKIEFKLELYTGSGAPVDSMYVEVRPVRDGVGVEWLTHRSRLHMRLRNALSRLGNSK